MESFLERARREQFVGCAIDALAAVGFAGTSVAEVARRAGVSKSVVLYHFESKSALLEAVVGHVYTAAAPPLVAALDAATSDRERLAAYVRGCVDFAWTHREQCRALEEVFRNLRTADGRLRYTAADNAELIAFAESLLLAGQRSGEFGEFDAHTLAVVLRSTIDALPGLFAADPAVRGPEIAEHLVHLIEQVIRPHHDGKDPLR